MDKTVKPKNKLLRKLPRKEWAELAPYLTLKHMNLRDPVYAPNKPIEHVYFVESGVLSLVALVGANDMIEVATVGNEGFVGVPVLHGAVTIPGLSFSQIPGDSYLLKAALLRDLLKQLPELHALLNHYAEILFTQIAQNAACNRAHNVDQRCARWLLLCHDRMEGATFPLTQEFLGQMLGVRRSAVNIAARKLQDLSLISYVRGIITVRNRKGLEKVSCECYGIVKKAFEDLL